MLRLTLSLVTSCLIAQPALAALASLGSDGKLHYQTHKLPGASVDRGDILPDFSWCGYKSSGAAIPVATVVKRLQPLSGDNRAAIQAAIDEVSRMPLNAQGLRGAILLEAGEYKVGGTLYVRASGVILRGVGRGSTQTRLVATQRTQHTLIKFSGSGGPKEEATKYKIQGSYIPIGTRTFTVEAGHNFQVGDAVIVRRIPNDAWITLLDMAQFGWAADGYDMAYKRHILAVAGNTLTIDAPLVDPVDSRYAYATVVRYAWPGRIENCGIEDMRLTSQYSGTEDESHGWEAVVFDQIQDSWMIRVRTYYFGYSAVSVGDGGYRISVLNCEGFDPISQTTGGRKYTFNVNGQLVLVKNCQSRNGRHDYVTGSQTSGPNAFVQCSATLQKADMGPHHRWGTGCLFDQITGDGALNVQNRGPSGSGHGWAGAQTLFWNCKVKTLIIQSPPGAVNWSVGTVGTITGKGGWTTLPAVLQESSGQPVLPGSLFMQQLRDRLQMDPNLYFAADVAVDGETTGALSPALSGNSPRSSLPPTGRYSLGILDASGRVQDAGYALVDEGNAEFHRLPNQAMRAGQRLLFLDGAGHPAGIVR